MGLALAGMAAYGSGCGPGSTSTSTTGGSGGTGGSTSTTTDMSCHYPNDDSTGFFSDAGLHGPFLPLPGELEQGASASCMGPWLTQQTFTGVSVVNTTSGIASLNIDVWQQQSDDITTLDIGAHIPAYQLMSVKSEKDSGGLSYYVFTLPATLVVDPGNVVCTAVPLTDLFPLSFNQGDCYEPRRTWWYGWTLQQGCGADGASCQDGASCTTGLPGICRTGEVTCNGNEANCVPLEMSVAEIKDNGYDDNCNGIIDSDTGPCAIEAEVCGDGKDNDCDGVIDNGCPDADGDGFPATRDCDDADPNVHPGAPEVCGDGKDNNCNGIVDDPSPGKPSWAPLGLPGDPGVGTYKYDLAYGLVK